MRLPAHHARDVRAQGVGPLRKTVRIFELADDFLLGTELTTEEGIVEADEDRMVNLVVQNQSHSMVRLHMENILGQLQDVEVLRALRSASI